MFQTCVVLLFCSIFLMIFELVQVGIKLYVTFKDGCVLGTNSETHLRGLSVVGLLPGDLLRIKVILLVLQTWLVGLFVYMQCTCNTEFYTIKVIMGVVLFLIVFWISMILPDHIVAFFFERHMNKLNRQMVEALQVMSMALRSGKTFSESLEAVAIHAPAPLCEEFSRMIQEVQYSGVSMEDALERMAERMPFKDMRIFVSTMKIVQIVGGSFADSLERSALLIRDRFRIRQKCQSLTAEGRFMAIAIALAPLANLMIFLVINFNPTVRFIMHPIGFTALILVSLMDYVGYRIIRAILNVEF
ncbi:TPA: hypothetical protein DDW35_10100 [Candidatus Sumerlaeota bacterium]|jgi:Flp pilus assembly protein TadB|nr:hypothetical protein [Candidatus Sumerlaeota bacterium]